MKPKVSGGQTYWLFGCEKNTRGLDIYHRVVLWGNCVDSAGIRPTMSDILYLPSLGNLRPNNAIFGRYGRDMLIRPYAMKVNYDKVNNLVPKLIPNKGPHQP